MVSVDPLPTKAAAVVETARERLLMIADYHAGFEAALRYEEGVELQSKAPDRKARLVDLLTETEPDRLVVLGDMTHSIGEPGGAERGELEVLFSDIEVPVTIAKGNHDGALESFLASDLEHFGGVSVTAAGGEILDGVGIAHGHTWPDPTVLEAEILCIGHEHPTVRLVDEVGGSRIERVWLRGSLDPSAFAARYDRSFSSLPKLIVFPAFNDLCGGTWVNVPEQDFLAPFLPEGLATGTVYLLDGTQLGPYDAV